MTKFALNLWRKGFPTPPNERAANILMTFGSMTPVVQCRDRKKPIGNDRVFQKRTVFLLPGQDLGQSGHQSYFSRLLTTK